MIKPSFMVVVVAAGFSACSSSAAGPAPIVDAGNDTHLSQDTGSGGCPARPDLEVAAPACNTVVSSGAGVGFTMGTGTPPTPAGGPIADGLYESTRAEGWGTGSMTGRRLTLVISGGATRILWAGDVLDSTGTTATSSLRANSTAAISGTQINLTTDCASGGATIPAAVGFTATGSDLVLSLGTGGNVFATTYTRRGCAP